jgi:hypothetical protein
MRTSSQAIPAVGHEHSPTHWGLGMVLENGEYIDSFLRRKLIRPMSPRELHWQGSTDWAVTMTLAIPLMSRQSTSGAVWRLHEDRRWKDGTKLISATR